MHLAIPRLFLVASLPALANAVDCLPAYSAEITAQGCYSDNETRTLTGTTASTSLTENTPQVCADICGVAGYKYAGVEYGSECYCGNEISSPGAPADDDGSCDTSCSGDSDKTCGGTWFINIYKISNPEDGSAVAPGLPNCAREPLCSNPICNTALSMKERVQGLIEMMTLREKAANMLNGAAGVQRLGLPPYEWWSEALHGVAGSPGVSFSALNGSEFSYATSFPMPINIGAAFDDDLVNRVASVIGREVRAFANHNHAGFDVWTPNINTFKDPRWGRGLEVPGEDPYHAQQYVYNLVDGLQGGEEPEVKTVIATCKHFAVYDVEEDRNSDDIDPTAQEFSEYYLPPFKTCARDAKVGAIMCSYNAEFGMPSCADRYLLQNVLREQWNWSAPYNWITSDCGAITNVVDDHHYVDTDAAAAGISVNAGTDLACENSIYLKLVDAVKQNITTEATIDKSLERLYSSLIQVGYFDAPKELAALGWKDVGTPEAQELAYLAAAEGMALLKNDGTLPVPGSISNVAVIGPWANATTQMQGNYQGVAPYLVSPLMAFESAWSGVMFRNGTDINTTSTSGFEPALDIARDSDYIVYCGGIDTTIEAEGHDRASIEWPGNQLQLIKQLSKLDKPLIVVQFGGGQVDDSSLLSDDGINAVLWAGYPGQEGGNAVRDALTGVFPVAGRLPITQYPSEYIQQVNKWDPSLRPVQSTGNPGRTYMWYPDAVLPFGYGLSYTNFSFSMSEELAKSTDIQSIIDQASGPVLGRDNFATVTVNVKNTGKVDSDYVGMLFLSTENAGPKPYPRGKLVSYSRARSIESGSTTKLQFPIMLEGIARVDKDGQFYIFPGDYKLTLDVDAQITIDFSLTGEKALLESMPLIPTKPVAISYLGCYDAEDQSDGPRLHLGSSNTPQACSDKCAGSNYTIAGTQGANCFCSSDISGSPLSDSKCRAVCPGNEFEVCGGDSELGSRRSIYMSTPPVHPESPTFDDFSSPRLDSRTT